MITAAATAAIRLQTRDTPRPAVSSCWFVSQQIEYARLAGSPPTHCWKLLEIIGADIDSAAIEIGRLSATKQ